MMRKNILILGTGMIAILWIATSAYYVSRPGNSVPLHQEQYRQLELSLYAYYIEHGYVPGHDAWISTKDERAFEEADGAIKWDASEKRLQYEFDKPYPVNIHFQHMLTFGLLPSGLESLGKNLNESAIVHNAPLFADDIGIDGERQ